MSSPTSRSKVTAEGGGGSEGGSFGSPVVPKKEEAVVDKHAAQIEVTSLEARLVKEPNSVEVTIRLCDLCLVLNKSVKSLEYLERVMGVFSVRPTTAQQGLAIVELGLKSWRQCRYSSKENNELRLNISPERAKILADVLALLEVIKEMGDVSSVLQVVQLKIAYVKECFGSYQDAIAILSDLITAQAMDGVDLNYIILKAAVLLHKMGGHVQAIEYLEFLLDDPPVAEGYTKTHVLAFLALVYDQHPQRNEFLVILGNTFDELKAAYASDLATGTKRPTTNLKKIDDMLVTKSFSQSSEVWEMLALQALDRCEYVFALELMQQAVNKVDNKPKLLHLLAELFTYMGSKERALACAERAFELSPQNAELRNLLLLLDPAKWQDQLRNARALERKKEVETEGVADVKLVKANAGADDDEGGWLKGLQETVAQPMSLFGAKVLSPEEKARDAKAAALKARKIKEKAAKKEKKLEERAALRKKQNRVPGKKRDVEVDGPAKPVKPFITIETMRIFNLARNNNPNVHLYEPDLVKFRNMRKAIEKSEREYIEMRKMEKMKKEKREAGGGVGL